MLTTLSVALVALLHALFMLLEMFLWKKPLGRKIFGLSREQAVSPPDCAGDCWPGLAAGTA